jgi:hypothetical protein
MALLDRIVMLALTASDGWGRKGLPLLLEGPPGEGKTSLVRAAARAAGLGLEVLSPIARGEGMFGVTPVPLRTDGGTRVEFPAPLGSESWGAVLVDDVRATPSHLQGALLDLVLERRLGNLTLGCPVIAAANAASVGGTPLSAAVINRFVTVEYRCSDIGESLGRMVGETDPGVYTYAKGPGVMAGVDMVRKFLTVHGGVYGREEPREDAPWASPRSWGMWAAVYGACADADVRDVLIDGIVGKRCAEAWRTWASTAALPTVDEMLAGNWDPEGLSGPEVIACVQELARTARDARVWGQLERAVRKCPDVVYKAVRDLLHVRPPIDKRGGENLFAELASGGVSRGR